MNPLITIFKNRSQPLEPVPTEAALRLEVLDGVETILFDIYGTLLISGSGDVGTAASTQNAEALTQSLIVSGYEGDYDHAGKLGAEFLQQEIERWHLAAQESGAEFPEVEISRVWKKIIERFQNLELLKPDHDPQKILRLAIEYECRVNPVWPMPGASETLKNLFERGFKLGLISNAQFYTPLMMEALFGKSLAALGFSEKLSVFSYKELRAKPSVELFQKLAGKIEFPKTLYVGNDMLNDIWTASQVGCRTILFAGDQRSLRLRKQDKRCNELIPDALVDHLYQITEMV